MSHLHLKSGLRSGFRLSTLALSVGMALMSSRGYALEALDDDSLAGSTGEGIAFLPENFSMVMQGANNTNPDQAYLDNRANDTGYIRLIPVGPLTTEAAASGAGKADIYLYGFAISQSNKDYGVTRDSIDWNGRFGRNIDSWGSAINPWILKVTTENDVPNFSALSPADTGKGDVSYLTLEAPLYGYTYKTDGTLDTSPSATELSAYNLKLGLWGDIFVRDPSVAESMTATGTQFNLGGANRANRLRLQAVWDGLSLNGTNLKIFQTLGGATNANGMSTFYNNTLGISGVLRLNGGDGQTLRASVSPGATITAPSAWSIVNNGCGNNSIDYGNAACQQRVRTRTATNTATSTWTPPSTSSVLRLSTRETTNTGLLATPAINGGVAPTFDSNEGLYLYNPNINLVLGSLYQPLTVGVAPDGNNITLEIARIPNKESIYKQVYTAYAGATGNLSAAQIAEYKGSTCNIYKCGTSNLSGYQGSNATHSSITIGSTVYNPTTNTLEAYKGVEAVGISFGSMSSSTNSVTTTYRDIQNQERNQRTREYGCGFGGWSTCYTYDWQYRQANGTYYAPNAGANNGSDAPANNRNWDLATNADWRAINSTTYGGGFTANPIPGAAVQNAPIASASNNFGSAVIDGLLIQHMKITTKGL